MTNYYDADGLFNYFELKNGIRIIHKPVNSLVAHCGFIIDTGSRDEQIQENGLVHFIEHAIFKGTHKRKSHHILNRIDSVGGELNAYTTKENTCIYASFTKNYLERSVDLLADIFFHSTFPEKEIEKEKAVIIEEIHSYQDSPFDQIYDDFEEMVFDNHPLKMNILGTTDSVKSINRKKVIDFIKKHYNTSNIVFSIVGDIPFKKVIGICEKYFGQIEEKKIAKKRQKFDGYTPKVKTFKRDTSQTHCMIGNVAYSAKDRYKNAFILVNNVLGGPAMNSRLNMGIREKYGLTYSIESTYTEYSDTGLFSIYLGTDENNLERSIQLTLKELKKLKTKNLSTVQLEKAKKQLMGQIALTEENNVNVMLGMGKSVLLYNQVDLLKDVYLKINKITSNEIAHVANEVFDEKQLSKLIYQ